MNNSVSNDLGKSSGTINSEPSSGQNLLIPTSIFADRTLKILEPIVEYLKESKNLSLHEIGVLMNRNDRTIWTAYHRVQQKRKPHVHAAMPEHGAADAVFLPSNIFLDRSLKVFEVVVEFLKVDKNLTYHQIAVLLNRDDRTIWTIYSRVRKKRDMKKSSSKGGQP